LESQLKKSIWITGGGSGIGRALALLYVQQGHNVVVSGRNQAKLDEVCQAGDYSSGGRMMSLPYNVSDDAQADAMIQKLDDLLGGLDLAIFSAGVCEYVDDGQLDMASFRRTYETNFFGVVNCCNIAKTLMLSKTNHGQANLPRQIAVVSSLSTVKGLPRGESYGSSKAALNYFADAFSTYLSSVGIHMSVIQPGFITTPMTSTNDFPMPFEMSAERAAERITRAIDKKKRMYRFPKRLFWLIKIASSWPSLWYKVLAPKLARVS